MDDLTDDELLAEAIADVAIDVLTRLAVEHGGAAIAEMLRLDPH